MKKILSLFLITFMLLTTFSACTIKRSVPSTQDFFIVNPLDRITPTSEIKSLNSEALEITLAKNEKEGAQFVLRSEQRQYNNLQVSATELKTEDGVNKIPAADVELFHLEYARQKDVRTSANLMMPLFDPDFNNLTSVIGENLVYYVRVTTKTETPAGIYLGEVTVTHDGGEVKIPLKVTVIDFTLPQRPSLKTDMLYWQSFTEQFYEENGNKLADGQAYEFFAEAVKVCRENKITVRTQYDEPMFDNYGTGHEKEYAAAVKKFLEDNPTVTIYNIPIIWTEWYKTINTERTLPIINALRDEGILDIGLMCTIDEPHTQEQYENLREIGEWIVKYAPDVNHYVTTFPTHIDMNIVNPEHIKVWCSVYPLMDIGTLKYYQKTYGSKFWGYGFDKGSNIDLNNIRAIGWELKKFDMIGLEDWCINSYTDYYTPETGWILTLDNAYKYSWFFPGMVGDGVVNKNKQIVTLTLENIRDTIEDYEYLIALETRVQEKLDALGLDITLDQAMESYYDGLFLDLHRLPAEEADGFATVRTRIIDEIINGVSYIITTKVDDKNWLTDNRYINIYTSIGSEIIIDGEPQQTLETDKYVYTKIYKYIGEESKTYEIKCEGRATFQHILSKDFDKKPVITLDNPDVYESLKKANPNTEFEIINDGDKAVLKIVFGSGTKRGFIIPAEIMTTPVGNYNYVRMNVWADSDENTYTPVCILNSENLIVTSSSEKFYPTTDKNTPFTCYFNKSQAFEAGSLLNSFRLSLNKSYTSTVTLYFSDIYFIKESIDFNWVIF